MEFREKSTITKKSVVATTQTNKAKTKVRVTQWEAPDKQGESWTIQLSEKTKLPDFPKAFVKDQKYFVGLAFNKEGQPIGINFINPADFHQEQAVFKGFAKSKDAERPEPWTASKPNAWGDYSQYFYALYELTDPESPFVGCILSQKYFYSFEDNGYGVTQYSSRGAAAKAMDDHFTKLGIFENSNNIAFPEDGNVLPAIEARALDAGKVLWLSGKVDILKDGNYAYWQNVTEITVPKHLNDEKPKQVEDTSSLTSEYLVDDFEEDEETLPDFMKDDDEDDWE